MDQASLSFCLWLSGIIIAVAISYYMIRNNTPNKPENNKCGIETYEDINDYGEDYGADYGSDIKDKIDDLIPKAPVNNKKPSKPATKLCLLI